MCPTLCRRRARRGGRDRPTVVRAVGLTRKAVLLEVLNKRRPLCAAVCTGGPGDGYLASAAHSDRAVGASAGRVERMRVLLHASRVLEAGMAPFGRATWSDVGREDSESRTSDGPSQRGGVRRLRGVAKAKGVWDQDPAFLAAPTPPTHAHIYIPCHSPRPSSSSHRLSRLCPCCSLPVRTRQCLSRPPPEPAHARRPAPSPPPPRAIEAAPHAFASLLSKRAPPTVRFCRTFCARARASAGRIRRRTDSDSEEGMCVGKEEMMADVLAATEPRAGALPPSPPGAPPVRPAHRRRLYQFLLQLPIPHKAPLCPR